MKRELIWLWRSPSLWWSFPPLLIFIALKPHIMWLASGLEMKVVEGMWSYVTLGWQFKGRSVAQENAFMLSAAGVNISDIETFMKLSVNDIWSLYLVPPLQAFAMIPLAALISPLAVAIFRRDVDGGAFALYRLNGGHALKFLLSKFLVSAIILLPFQVLIMELSLSFYAAGSGHPELFLSLDPIWLLSWLGLGYGLGLWTVVISWIMCLCSSNISSEIYSSMLASSFGILLASFGVRTWGWDVDSLIKLTLCLWLSTPILFVILWKRMQMVSYHFK
jgi:hypothetical protein